MTLRSRLRSAWLWFYRQTIWHPDAVPPEHFVYRHLKRVWLPIFDLISILIGYLAIDYGSTLLNEHLPKDAVDISGAAFLTASAVALIGVTIPKLWLPEIFGKIVMMALLGTYSAFIWISFFNGETASGFVAAVLMLPIILPLARIQWLGEERKQRVVQETQVTEEA